MVLKDLETLKGLKMFIDSEEAALSAASLVLDVLPEVGSVGSGDDRVSFHYKGLRYEFYDFVALNEFLTKHIRKERKRTTKEIARLRDFSLRQAKIITKLNAKLAN